MTNDDIAQKLARLPEGVAERNLQSWNNAIELLGRPVDIVIAEYFPYTFEMHKLATIFSISEQAKLFRAEGRYDTLIISTTDRQELKFGEPFLRVFIDRGFLAAQYQINDPTRLNIRKKISDNIHFRTGNDAITFLQPMLDLLWDETRGKKNV